ncbi:MAG: hypothetical protein KAT48_14145 [Bacteroidales bacterium]|nr:hypothetical protein [Bacteroidales bacterium]
MDIKIIENNLNEIFQDAEDVKDTIWYSDIETLFDAILTMVDTEIKKDEEVVIKHVPKMLEKNKDMLDIHFERIREIIETDEYLLLVDKFGAMRVCVDAADRIIHGDPEIRRQTIRADIRRGIRWLSRVTKLK